jgi:hypothetical protein
MDGVLARLQPMWRLGALMTGLGLLVAGCGQASVSSAPHQIAVHQPIAPQVQRLNVPSSSDKEEARVQAIARRAVARLRAQARAQHQAGTGLASSTAGSSVRPSAGGVQGSSRVSDPVAHSAVTTGSSARSVAPMASVQRAASPSGTTAPQTRVAGLTPSGVKAIVSRYLAAQRAKRLLYRSSVGSVNGWTPLGTGSWTPFTYAQPIDGYTQLLRYEGEGRSSFTAPYTIPSSNYAVETRIRWLGYVNAAAYPSSGFGLFVRARGPLQLADGRGVIAGVRYIAPPQSLGPARPDYSWASIGRPGQVRMSTGSFMTDFRPGVHWHTYRLEVRGPQMTLFIDGMEAAEMTSNRYFMGRHVGIYSLGARIEVASFRVVALNRAKS